MKGLLLSQIEASGNRVLKMTNEYLITTFGRSTVNYWSRGENHNGEYTWINYKCRTV